MWVHLSAYRFGRAAIASVTGVVLVAACGNSDPQSTSSSSQEQAPITVGADAKYSGSELPFVIESTPYGLAVTSNGDVYMTTDEGLESLAPGAGKSRTVVPDLPNGFGFAATDSRAVVGSGEELVVVELSTGAFDYVPVANVGDIWAVAIDRDDNVYVTGAGRPDGRVIKLNRELADPTNIPFPGLAGNASIAVGPDHAIYVVDGFDGQILVLRPGEQNPTALQLEGAKAPARVAVNPAGDLFVIDSDDPGHFSTSPLPVRLLRYPAASTTPVELATYVTNAYLVAADAAGNVYYTASDGDKTRVMKLSPNL